MISLWWRKNLLKITRIKPVNQKIQFSKNKINYSFKLKKIKVWVKELLMKEV
jgi:hypothetical protein